MTPLEQALHAATRSGRLQGISLATLRAGALGEAHAVGERGAHDRRRVDEGTVFEAASLTKPLVAFIALQLAQEGRLDLDTPLHELCGAYVPDDPRARRITGRHVLTHTSGLPNVVGPQTPFRTCFEPGERFSYGSSAFGWLQRAMEQASGRPLQQLARERVFQPLRMQRSSLTWHERFDDNHARGREWHGEPAPQRRLGRAQASWSLLTTAGDYIRFVRATLQGYGLAPDVHARWLAPAVPARADGDPQDLPGERPPSTTIAWGLGWGLEPAQGCFFHWGHCPGFRAFVLAHRASGNAVVWLANAARGLRLAHDVLPLAVPGPHPSVAWLQIGRLADAD
ncbi:MAG: serine hydrolase domain-containing protein [Ottowia sp.]|uniref:serine hydrolase domain-containing protein n=1 Tax=Ottowia sp. TaxID=1898956 RepID=UPI0039E5D1DD